MPGLPAAFPWSFGPESEPEDVASFPFAKTYAVHLLPSQISLTPAFAMFKRMDTGANLTPPNIVELIGSGMGQGWYAFSWLWMTPNDPPIAYVINGNAPGSIDPSTAMEGQIQPTDVPVIETGFPVTKRYGFHYLPGQSGLAPAFTLCVRLDTWAAIVPQPTIYELDGSGNGDGWYYFDWTWNTALDPDIAFLINGAAPSAISPPYASYGILTLNDIGFQAAPPPAPMPVVAPNPLASTAPIGLNLGADIDWATDLNPNFTLVNGLAVLGQDLAHRLETPRGTVPYDQGYGFDTRALLNETTNASSLAAWRHGIESECLKDERVSTASAALNFQGQENSLSISISVGLSTGPFVLVDLAVNNLTVSLLSVTPANQ